MTANRMGNRAYIEIDLDNLRHNVGVLNSAMPLNCSLMAVVKAGAYGHGAFEISSTLEQCGVSAFAVATIDEAVSLRKKGIRGEILILGYTNVCRASELKKYDLIQTIISYEYAEALNNEGIHVNVHIKTDTGMHRLGIDCDDYQHVANVFSMKNINVCGIYTHLACSDSNISEDVAFTMGQIDRFYELIANLRKCGISIPKLHIQSSYGLMNYPYLRCNYVRCGMALYGVKSRPDDETLLKLDLQPVLSLKAEVALIRKIKSGESYGYGRSFRAKRDTLIAILPLGYKDGIPRSLSDGRGSVIVRGCKAKIVGKVCMDQLAVDITDICGAHVGDIATIIGEQGDISISAADLAGASGSIGNELLCRLGERLPVLIKEKCNKQV